MEGDHFDDPDLDGKIILKLIFKKLCGGHGLDLSGSQNGDMCRAVECSNGHSGFMKFWEFLD
jgi:hypothetical protein